MRRKALFTYTSYCKCTSFIRIFIRQREPRKLTCRIYESHFLQIFKNVLFTQLLFLYHSGMILQQKQPQQLIITTTGQIPQQQPQQPYETNKVYFTQQSQPIISQQPVVNQGSIVMYPPETAIIQGTFIHLQITHCLCIRKILRQYPNHIVQSHSHSRCFVCI